MGTNKQEWKEKAEKDDKGKGIVNPGQILGTNDTNEILIGRQELELHGGNTSKDCAGKLALQAPQAGTSKKVSGQTSSGDQIITEIHQTPTVPQKVEELSTSNLFARLVVDLKGMMPNETENSASSDFSLLPKMVINIDEIPFGNKRKSCITINLL
ncbi:unnamed protein product [Ilex paraguariensis]|uniref:Uncharacterized protein n=1 Tax=Ilex paraguariensis TaxID=185542 RepID=A0ABC8QSP6_9AQUA